LPQSKIAVSARLDLAKTHHYVLTMETAQAGASPANYKIARYACGEIQVSQGGAAMANVIALPRLDWR
jgi:hypothetical protein